MNFVFEYFAIDYLSLTTGGNGRHVEFYIT